MGGFSFSLLEKGETVVFPVKRAKRSTEASSSNSHPASESRIHAAPGMWPFPAETSHGVKTKLKVVYTRLLFSLRFFFVTIQCAALHGKHAAR